jgi:hypothetical protein
MHTKSPKTFTAGEDLEAKRRVKIKSGTTTSPPEVEYADAGEVPAGVTEYAVDSGDLVAVKLWNEGGTFEVESIIGTAIAVGASLYGAADGRLSDTVSSTAQATAMEAAAADNDHIEVLPL